MAENSTEDGTGTGGTGGTGGEGTGGAGGTDGKGGTEGKGSGAAGEKNWQEEAEKWKALSRKNEASAKRLQAIEDSQKTELQKAQERAAALEEENKTLTKKAMRAQVGADKKLPSTIAARLQGDTLEEMMADADAILKDLGGTGGSGGSGGGSGGRNHENLQSLLQDSAGKNGQLPDMNAFMRSQRGGSGA